MDELSPVLGLALLGAPTGGDPDGFSCDLSAPRLAGASASYAGDPASRLLTGRFVPLSSTEESDTVLSVRSRSLLAPAARGNAAELADVACNRR